MGSSPVETWRIQTSQLRFRIIIQMEKFCSHDSRLRLHQVLLDSQVSRAMNVTVDFIEKQIGNQ